MTKNEMITMLRCGEVRKWNAFRKANPSLKIDLRHAVLHGVDFTKANLRGVDFTGADLTCVDFSGADLTGARLQAVVLSCSYNARTKFDEAHKSLIRIVDAEAVIELARVQSPVTRCEQ